MDQGNVVNFHVLQRITELAKKLENSHLDGNELRKIKDKLQEFAEYLGVTNEQAIVFICVFVLQIQLYSIDTRDIIRFLSISIIDGINLKTSIDALLIRNLLVNENGVYRKVKRPKLLQTTVNVNPEISELIYANQSICMIENKPLDIYEFVKAVSELIQKRSNEEIETSDLLSMVLELEKCNPQLDTITTILPKLTLEDRTLLYEVANDSVVGFPSSLGKTLSDIFDNAKVRFSRVRNLLEKNNPMFDLGYITIEESRFANDSNIQMSTYGLELFFKEDASLFVRRKNNKNMIQCKDIDSKELFYDDSLSKEIDFLIQSLKKENFTSLQDRLANMSLPKGVACIFYGSPGTGKTETALQLARATGRAVIKVDISQSKSMWFGESEKKIKEIFDSYRRVSLTSEMVPILLFNEADALLGKRKDNSNSSNTSQTENSIQNIILDELEKFEGIMIATTNLQGNLDEAYERRFLFKIKFETPSVEVKSKIWLEKLKWLDSYSALKLAKDFSFSGGEIDNVVRKITMKEVLTGVRPESSEIIELCQNEKQLSRGKNGFKVGFK